MITVKGPVEIKTTVGTVLVTTREDGQIFIEVYQEHGVRKYCLSGLNSINLRDGKLIEKTN